MTTRESFPLVDEQTLARPVRRMLRWWRDPSTLPAVPPGAVLVFGTGGRTEVVDCDRFSGYEDVLIDATTAGVVDCRKRAITTELRISSYGQAFSFLLRVTFAVEVSDAGSVFRHGIRNVESVLFHCLRQDEEIVKFDDRYTIDELVSARKAISAYIMSAYTQRPPRIDGVRVAFQDVAVETPPEVGDHGKAMQVKYWDAEKERFDWKQEQDRVAHVERLARTPEELENLAIARGERTAAAVADGAYERREKATDRLWAEVQRLEANGEADRDSVNRQHLVARLDRLLTGSEPPQAAPRSAPRELHQTRDDESVYVPTDDDDED